MAKKTYKMTIGSVTRELPIVPLNDKLSIAGFVVLGDTELTEECAKEIAARITAKQKAGLIPQIDILVSPEAKAIALTHALARNLGIDYVIVRKGIKAYMQNPIVETVQSITTKDAQKLVLDVPDMERLAGKNVCMVDDVVSTGGSFAALSKILSRTGCTIAAKAAVLLEDAGYKDPSLIYIADLPVFKN